MPASLDNFVKEETSSTGTGNVTLSSLTGFRQFSQSFSTGGTDKFYYSILHKTADEWETGTGHLSDNTTLVRDTVIDSSNSDSLVDFSSGDKFVLSDLPSSDLLIKGSATKTLRLMAEDMWGSQTKGADGPTQSEVGTENVNFQELLFSDYETEYAEVSKMMPDNWDGGTVDARIFWRASNSGTVAWGLQGISYGDGQGTSTGWGTLQAIEDSASDSTSVFKTSKTDEITLTGSPAGGEMAHFRVRRAPSGLNLTDNMTGYARLLAIQIEYQEDQYSH